MIDGHGDDLWRYGGRVKYNFSTNIHSAFDHSPLMDHIASSAHAILSYPEPEPVSVEKKIANLQGCNIDEVMVTNGATEAIYMIAKEFSRCTSSILSPTFREYQDACKMYLHKVQFLYSLAELSEDSEVVWICNPNNPTGRVIARESLADTFRHNSKKVFVVDQAYSNYTLLPTLTAQDVVDAGNVIMLGSLTKRFAVPGLRIGYAIANSNLLARLKKWRMPWSINGIAIESAKFLLDNIKSYNIDAQSLHSEALRIADELGVYGIEIVSTDCNFMLCRLPYGTAAELKQYLIDEAGILIRDASNFEGLTDKHFRVAAQSTQENDLLLHYIKKFMQLKLHLPCQDHAISYI